MRDRGRRRPNRSATADRARSARIKGILRIVGVFAVVAVIASAYMYVQSSHRTLDETTLCPADPSSITVLLVDVTDPMSTPQRQDFMNQLAKLKNSIPRYGKLIVAKVDATAASLLTPVIVRCNPGTAADVSETTGNPATVQRKWNEGFDKPLQQAFEHIASASGADQSPILESIQSVALTELQKPSAEGKPRRLVVASDLLQNTEGASFYKGLPDPRDFTNSPEFRKTRTDLRGVTVELWMLERSDAAATQPRALADLWERIITTEGGDLIRTYNVSG